ncbi:MAG: heme lyase CcmF/NrfE family subunit [Lysobacterales bacterium]
MIPELGQWCMVLALLLAGIQAIVPMAGSYLGDEALMRSARPLAYGQCLFLLLAFLLLAQSFVAQDFSVAYVAQNSNLDLPVAYRISAVWGAHEGSLLLWTLILSLWTVAVAVFSRGLPLSFISRVLAVLGLVSVGFLILTIFASNPFLRHLPPLADGNDLNPLLQDPGLIIHPPMLYVGYVGFSVAFAFAVAALLDGRVDQQWVRWSRPWTNVAWSFLTLGIGLGSWWAYYELGWGGWWFWDPVENASFMPWLIGAALIHSQAVTEKRGTLRTWTLLLSIAAFSLSLMGAFLVRSGVLTSVHAFASDPTRGLYILIFLGVVTGGALLIYALRAPRIAGGPPLGWCSREALLLLNNLLLATACAMVLLGTLYPLLVDALGMGKISVGPPYFGNLFYWLMAPLVLLIPLGPLTRWQGDRWADVLQPLRLFAVIAAVAGLLLAWLSGDSSVKSVLGLIGALWVALGTLVFLLRRVARRQPGRPLLSAEMLGMSLGHVGVAIFIIGVMLTEALSIERDVRLEPGQTETIGAYQFRYVSMRHLDGPNYRADEALIQVLVDDELVAEMRPQKRGYRGGQVMTEAAINPGLFRDLYVALGEPVGANEAWAMRLYHKPMIRWIWLGAIFMMLGGLISAAESRLYRRVRQSAAEGAAGAHA